MKNELKFTVTGDKSLEVVIGHVRQFRKRSDEEILASVTDAANDMQHEVRSRAEGRPGPRKITGGYWSSIKVFTTLGLSFLGRGYSKSVGSYHPAAHRLEMGFTAVDSLGRHYNQPPFAHWRPAMVVVHQRWIGRFNNALPRWWG